MSSGNYTPFVRADVKNDSNYCTSYTSVSLQRLRIVLTAYGTCEELVYLKKKISVFHFFFPLVKCFKDAGCKLLGYRISTVCLIATFFLQIKLNICTNKHKPTHTEAGVYSHVSSSAQLYSGNVVLLARC